MIVAAVLIGVGLPRTALAAPDAWITTKAKMALLTTAGVSASAINVDTVDGRVTLHGKVATESEKVRAESVVREVEGATQVRNLLQVVPVTDEPRITSSDVEIGQAVTEALAADEAAADIAVQSVHDGVVLLGGSAPTMTAHLHALQVARAVPGVRRVASEVRSPGELSDVEIRGDAESSLTHESGKAATAAGDAAKAAGQAVVEGTRASGEAAERGGDAAAGGARALAGGAEAAGRSAAGAASDTWITSATKLRLLADEEAPAFDVNVDTRDRVVTLFGIVGTEQARTAAEAEARKVSGVQAVHNELQVVPAAEQAAVTARDAEIRRAVEDAIEKRTALEEADIDVAVSAGVVRLTGIVPSARARAEAVTIARATSGVRSVLEEDLHVAGEASG